MYNSGLRERIEDFMESAGLKESDFPVKKLIILVPSSGYTFPKLSDDTSLPETERDIEPVEVLLFLVTNKHKPKILENYCRDRVEMHHELCLFVSVFAGSFKGPSWHSAEGLPWRSIPNSFQIRKYNIIFVRSGRRRYTNAYVPGSLHCRIN